MTEQVKLGYELETGREVFIPTDLNIAATGQTRRTGKTTALEAVFTRANKTCLTFKTKKNETGFLKGRTIEPYYRPRSDWVYVKSLAEAALDKELPGMYDRWFMDACGETGKLPNPRDLQEVRRNITILLEGSSSFPDIREAKGFAESMLISIRGYLDLVLPDLVSRKWSSSLDLQEGSINVMDLVGLSESVQSLVIASCIEEVNERWERVDILVPEAPDFFPAGRGSPAKVVARRLARKGGSSEDFLHLDAQMIVGVDPVVRSQTRLWLLGPQQYEHEVERTLKLLPNLGRLRPSPTDVQTMPLGHFYLVIAEDKIVKKVYAQPWWLPDEAAKRIALGKLSPKSDEVKKFRESAISKHEEDVEETVYSGKVEKLEEENREQVASFESNLAAAPPFFLNGSKLATLNNEDIARSSEPRSSDERERPDIILKEDRLKVQIEAHDKPMEFTTNNVRGQIMRVMCELIDPERQGKRASQLTVRKQAQEFGYYISDSGGNRDQFTNLVKEGALIKESDGYRLPSRVEFKIKRKEKEPQRCPEENLGFQLSR